jgi:ABC-type glycerol-3-phosphate transport system substrate-binding protein
MIDIKEPFAPGTPHYEIYKLMYDVAKEKLIEEDPLTTDWESSKQMMADGEIATMVLGVWAVPQVQALADNPDDIGIMAFPSTAKDGKQYVRVAPDLPLMINKNSKNKEAALAYFWWFINESGFAVNEVCIPPTLDGEMPAALDAITEAGAVLFTEDPSPAGKEGLLDKIDQTGEVGLWTQDFKYRIIEAAIGNRPDSFDEIMNDLNTKWQKGQKEVLGQ